MGAKLSGAMRSSVGAAAGVGDATTVVVMGAPEVSEGALPLAAGDGASPGTDFGLQAPAPSTPSRRGSEMTRERVGRRNGMAAFGLLS